MASLQDALRSAGLNPVEKQTAVNPLPSARDKNNTPFSTRAIIVDWYYSQARNRLNQRD